jgi:hypothetical protein
MLKAKSSSRNGSTPLQSGQIWQVDDSNVQIKHVGKRLVHYERLKGTMKRGAVSMSAKQALEKYLREHHGVLIRPGKDGR